MRFLAKDIGQIGFFEREKTNGKYVLNKCGRDFLYYALNYHYPDAFNGVRDNPIEIERKGLFGLPVPSWLAWTGVQFYRVPEFLGRHGLKLFINGREVKTFLDFARSILFSRKSCEQALLVIQESVDANIVSGVDISMGFGGLYDHVIFVYGYDAENLYVIDTRKVEMLGYAEVYPGKYLFKFSKAEIQKRWTRFGRVWKVAP